MIIRLLDLTCRHGLVVWLVTILISGCQAADQSADDDDLASFVARVTVTPARPTFKPLPALYTPGRPRDASADHPSPFGDDDPARAPTSSPAADSPPLERFPLAKLKLQGILATGARVQALIKTPEGELHQVAVGDYLGSQRGRVERITDNTLTLTEPGSPDKPCRQLTLIP